MRYYVEGPVDTAPDRSKLIEDAVEDGGRRVPIGKPWPAANPGSIAEWVVSLCWDFECIPGEDDFYVVLMSENRDVINVYRVESEAVIDHHAYTMPMEVSS